MYKLLKKERIMIKIEGKKLKIYHVSIINRKEKL
jgi:hypothetical protein